MQVSKAYLLYRLTACVRIEPEDEYRLGTCMLYPLFGRLRFMEPLKKIFDHMFEIGGQNDMEYIHFVSANTNKGRGYAVHAEIPLSVIINVS